MMTMTCELHPGRGIEVANALRKLGIECSTQYHPSDTPCQRHIEVIAAPKSAVEALACQAIMQ